MFIFGNLFICILEFECIVRVSMEIFKKIVKIILVFLFDLKGFDF